MAKKVDYRSDITYLIRKVRLLASSLRLPVDGELFAEFVDRELHFLSVTTGRLHRSMRESAFTDGRRELMIDLRHLTVLCAETIGRLLRGEFPMGGSLSNQLPRYRRLRDALLDGGADLDRQIRGYGDSEEPEQIVSAEELRSLLPDEEP